MAAPLVHFEIHATNRQELATFYESVFGWSTNAIEQMPYTLISPTGGNPQEPPLEGIGGGMLDRQGPAPQLGAPVNGFVCVIQVDDLVATKSAILAHGGGIALDIMTIQGVGQVFYFHDPDRNLVGCMQPE